MTGVQGEIKVDLTGVFTALRRHCQHDSIDKDPSEVLHIHQREQLYYYLAQECSKELTITTAPSSILCELNYEMLYVLLSQLSFDILFPSTTTDTEQQEASQLPNDCIKSKINIPAITSLAYLLTGLWLPESAGSNHKLTLSKLQECVYSIPELAMHLIDLLNSKIIVVKKLVLFILYTQNIERWLEVDELQMVMDEVSAILCREDEEDKKQTESAALSLAALQVTQKLLNQYPEDFLQLEVSKQMEYMVKRLFSFTSREAMLLFAKDEKKRREFRLLVDCLHLFPSTKYDDDLLSMVLQQSKAISKSISDVLAMKQLQKEHKLYVSESIWSFWLMMISKLVERPEAEQSQSVQSIGSMMEKTRKKMISKCTTTDIETQQMHVLSYIDIEDNVDAQSKYWIARVKFYELLAPKQGAGYLVLPLQQMLKLSRFVVSKCYLRLIQILVHAKKWYSPSGGMKLLLRCINHLITVVPPNVASTSSLTCNSNGAISIQEYQDYSESVYLGTNMLSVYLKHIDTEDWEYVYNSSVTIGNKTATQSGDDQRASLSALLQRLEALIATEDNDGPNPDADFSEIKKRLQLIRMNAWLVLQDSIRKFESFQHHHWLVNNTEVIKRKHVEDEVISIQHVQGLFGLKHVFQKEDLLKTIHSRGNSEARELSSSQSFDALDQCVQQVATIVDFSINQNTKKSHVIHDGDKWTSRILQDMLHACVNDWQRNVYFLAFAIFQQLHQLDQQSPPPVQHGNKSNGLGKFHDITNPLISTPLSFYMCTPMDYLHQSQTAAHPTTSFMITTTSTTNTHSFSPWKAFCSLDEQAMSQPEDSLRHPKAADYSKETTEQLVLASSIPLVIEETKHFLRICLQICEMLQNAIKTNVIEQIRQEYLSVHGYVVESMWWFLHRTTTFHIDFTSEEMKAVCNMLQQHNLISSTYHGNEGSSGIPDIAVGMVFSVSLIHFQLLSDMKLSSIDDPLLPLMSNQAELQHTLLSSALSCSINSLTESGVLPLIAEFLPKFLSLNFLDCAVETDSLASRNHVLVFVAYFTSNVFQKFSSMVQPTMSEQADDALMETLVEGLRPILLLPALLLQIIQPLPDDVGTSEVEGCVYTLLAAQSTEIHNLFRLWLQLEDILHRHRQQEDIISAEIQEFSRLLIGRGAVKKLPMNIMDMPKNRVVIMQRLLLIAKLLQCSTTPTIVSEDKEATLISTKIKVAWITSLLKESLPYLLPFLDNQQDISTHDKVEGKLKRKYLQIFVEIFQFQKTSCMEILTSEIVVQTCRETQLSTTLEHFVIGMTLCLWQQERSEEYKDLLQQLLQQFLSHCSIEQLVQCFQTIANICSWPTNSSAELQEKLKILFESNKSHKSSSSTSLHVDRKRKLEFSLDEQDHANLHEVIDLQSAPPDDGVVVMVGNLENQPVGEVDEDETCHSVQQDAFLSASKAGTALKRQATPAANVIRNPVDGSEIKLKRIRQGFAPMTYTSVDRTNDTPAQSQFDSQSQCLSPALLVLNKSLLPPKLKPDVPPQSIVTARNENNAEKEKVTNELKESVHSLSPTASDHKEDDPQQPINLKEDKVNVTVESDMKLTTTASIQKCPELLIQDVQRLLSSIESTIGTTTTDNLSSVDTTALYDALQTSHQLSSTIAQIIVQHHQRLSQHPLAKKDNDNHQS